MIRDDLQNPCAEMGALLALWIAASGRADLAGEAVGPDPRGDFDRGMDWFVSGDVTGEPIAAAYVDHDAPGDSASVYVFVGNMDEALFPPITLAALRSGIANQRILSALRAL